MSEQKLENSFTRREVLAGGAIAFAGAALAGTANANPEKPDTRQVIVYVTDAELVAWTQTVVAGFKKGIPLIQIFSEAGAQTDNDSLRVFSTDAVAILKMGHPLSSVMKLSPHLFDEDYITVVRYGEMTGELDSVLEKWLTDGAKRRNAG